MDLNGSKADDLSSYDKETNTGGSNGATMRFAPEGDHGANAGLKAARDFLEPIKRSYFLSHTKLTALISHRKIPLDQLLRPLDPRWCVRHPRNAGAYCPVEARPGRSRCVDVHSRRAPA